ncbi:MAG: site-2 protease family protein [Anaerolineae bacterium]|nr:site-2 protease family protein [Anaerolineae bacterium]
MFDLEYLLSLDRLIALLIMCLTSMPVHEWAHAWTAYELGDDTAALHGRLTLNPLAHMDLYGTISLFLGFLGWGKPVPVNINRLRGNMRASWALVSIAGPFSNLVMAMLAAIPFRLELLNGSGEIVQFLQQVFAYMIIINLSLMLFNLIPVPPLDGSRILGWLLPGQLAQGMDRLERVAGPMLIIVAFLIARLPLFNQILTWLLQLLLWY